MLSCRYKVYVFTNNFKCVNLLYTIFGQTLRGHEHVVESVTLCDAVQLSLDQTKAAVNAKVEKV